MTTVLQRVRLAVVFVVAATAAGPAFAQVQNWPTENPPRPMAARDIKFPPYQLQTLPNGLQVVRR